jgi:hypothetical protein
MRVIDPDSTRNGHDTNSTFQPARFRVPLPQPQTGSPAETTSETSCWVCRSCCICISSFKVCVYHILRAVYWLTPHLPHSDVVVVSSFPRSSVILFFQLLKTISSLHTSLRRLDVLPHTPLDQTAATTRHAPHGTQLLHVQHHHLANSYSMVYTSYTSCTKSREILDI